MKQLKALLAYLKAQFLKLVNLKKAPAPSPQPVVPDPRPVYPAYPTSPPKAVDPVAVEWQRRLAKYGDDLWAVMKGENITLNMADMAPAKAAGFTKTEAFAAQWAQGRPIEPANPDRLRTALVYGAEDGKLFKAQPNTTTTYTLTVPQGNDKVTVLNMGRDGEAFADQHATLSINDGVAQDVSREDGPVFVAADPGDYKFAVTCNYEWTIQLQSRPK